MGNINKELLIRELFRQNPWFKNKQTLAEDIKMGKRVIYTEIFDKVINNNLITAVTGLRRIGKTTLIRQIINGLLKKSADPQKIAYFSFEEATLMAVPNLLEEIICYQIDNNPKGKLFFFFDEIQYVNLWNAVLKKYYDSEPRLKFVVTGSSGLFIKTAARETLAGRILETVMRPLGFGEYLHLIKKINLPEVKPFSYQGLRSYEPTLQKEFESYLTFGEFPYLSFLSSFNDQKQYVLDWVIAKIIESDLPKLRRFVHSGELLNLTNILISGSGQLIELQNLASDLGIDRKTLSSYLDLLEKTHLIGTIFNFKGSFRTKTIGQRKIYSNSVNAVVLKNTSGTNSESFYLKIGQIAESFVFNYLCDKTDKLFFWRERGKEVDFIFKLEDLIIPIEVKCQSQIKKPDLENILFFCRKRKLKQAIIITKDRKEEKEIFGVRVIFIPAYFLL